MCGSWHDKMKYYPLLFCRFRAPVIHSFFVVFALLFLSKSVVAMPYAHEVVTQGRSFDIFEHDKQVPIKLSLLSVSIRASVSSTDVLGGLAPEEFREYDVAVYLLYKVLTLNSFLCKYIFLKSVKCKPRRKCMTSSCNV